jgi:hypothetical protein
MWPLGQQGPGEPGLAATPATLPPLLYPQLNGLGLAVEQAGCSNPDAVVNITLPLCAAHAHVIR